MKKLFVLLFASATLFANAQTKKPVVDYRLPEIGTNLMESYYTMKLSLSFTTLESIENLKHHLRVTCDSLENRIKRSKAELTLKLGEKDLKDLEFQLSNYKQYVNKSQEEITGQQLNSVNLWIMVSRPTVEKLFVKLVK